MPSSLLNQLIKKETVFYLFNIMSFTGKKRGGKQMICFLG